MHSEYRETVCCEMELEIKMAGKQKLELTWIGKDQVTKLEPRILIEDAELSYHSSKRHGDADIFDNKLIFGDNLLALKALEQEYAGKVKCVFIDPPYNTGSAFTHYDDGVEHSLWLSLMRDRLEIIKRLLADDGSLWITIDDNEAHYLKVLCDEIFGRSNFLASAIWNHSVQSKGYSGKFSVHHNYVFVYQKSSAFVLKDLPRQEEHNVNYSNPDNDPRGPWRSGDVRNSLVRPNLMYNITTPNGNVISHPPKGWRFSRDTFERELAEGKIVFSKDETRIIRKIYLADQEGRVPETIWFAKDVGTTRQASAEIREFVNVEFFDTPKPERLISQILLLATSAGDLVLDSFAGSGTTGAVAHKMGRRWIMVELGEHCHTHVIPRLKKVIDGEDEGGITEAVNWKGGGGFRYYKVAPSLLAKDKWGNWVINQEYDANMLAAAVCKHEGFTYSPSDVDWWAHGYSTETDFIYVTTQTLTEDQLVALSEEVGNDRTLLVCCAAYKASAAMLNDKLKNLTLKKMPNALLSKCEWGKDDYSLNVSKLPVAEQDDDIAPASKQKANKEADLFDDAE
jgi:adenine-specific DNA-methyltransferase